MALLEVRDLKTYFHTRDGIVKAVDGVSFDVGAGETVGGMLFELPVQKGVPE